MRKLLWPLLCAAIAAFALTARADEADEPAEPAEPAKDAQAWPRTESVPDGREASDLWPGMVPAWNEIEARAQQLDSAEAMQELAAEIGRFEDMVKDVMAGLPWAPTKVLLIETGHRWVRIQLNKLKAAAEAGIPGQVQELLPPVRYNLWVWQGRFPEGYLPEPHFPKTPATAS